MAFVGAVGAEGEHEAADIGEGGQRIGREVVRVDFGIDAEGAEVAGEGGGPLAAEVDDDNHVLLHGGSFAIERPIIAKGRLSSGDWRARRREWGAARDEKGLPPVGEGLGCWGGFVYFKNVLSQTAASAGHWAASVGGWRRLPKPWPPEV